MKLISVIGIRGLPGIQGGVEMHCENLYPLMCASGDVRVRVYRRKSYLTPQSVNTYPNIEYVDLPSTRIKGFEAVFHTFLCVIHILFHRPDAVHIHNIGPGMFAPCLRLFRLRVLLTYHSPNYEHEKWGIVARNILKFSEWLALGFSNEIIFVNKFQMGKYSPGVKAKSHYIPNGVNVPGRSTNEDFLLKNAIVPGEYVLGVGRLTPEKGFEYLIEAVQSIDGIKQLVIAGASDHDTKYFDKLKAIDRNHKVVFTGFTAGEDLRQLYSHARLFVLSSVNEGFPLVMLEAMGYGLPMVVSDIPATHLVQLPQSCYVPAASPDRLAAIISREYTHAQHSVKYDMDAYDWGQIAKTTASIF